MSYFGVSGINCVKPAALVIAKRWNSSFVSLSLPRLMKKGYAVSSLLCSNYPMQLEQNINGSLARIFFQKQICEPRHYRSHTNATSLKLFCAAPIKCHFHTSSTHNQSKDVNQAPSLNEKDLRRAMQSLTDQFLEARELLEDAVSYSFLKFIIRIIMTFFIWNPYLHPPNLFTLPLFVC